MVCSFRTNFITIAIIKLAVVQSEPNVGGSDIYESLKDHTMVTDRTMFPYVASIIKTTSYISSGAIVSDNWILTAADALYLVRESIRQLRVRVGSINYKKDGLVLRIKYFRLHPYFNNRTPIYDLALLRLSQPITHTTFIRPISLKKGRKKQTSNHFIVTSWAAHKKNEHSDNKSVYTSKEIIHRNRHLMVRKMHPTDLNKCRVQQEKLEISNTDVLLCLDSTIGSDRCARATGAPVVVNGLLWGIVSSWRPEDCQTHPGSSFVNLVSSPNISSWIDAVLRDLHWKLQNIDTYKEKHV